LKILPATSIRLLRLVEFGVAGLLALLGRESGQVRKEAATATEASAGGRARHLLILQIQP